MSELESAFKMSRPYESYSIGELSVAMKEATASNDLASLTGIEAEIRLFLEDEYSTPESFPYGHELLIQYEESVNSLQEDRNGK